MGKVMILILDCIMGLQLFFVSALGVTHKNVAPEDGKQEVQEAQDNETRIMHVGLQLSEDGRIRVQLEGRHVAGVPALEDSIRARNPDIVEIDLSDPVLAPLIAESARADAAVRVVPHNARIGR